MLISTENTEDFWAKLLSLPSWERGLKLPPIVEGITGLIVAPLVGAWIETDLGSYKIAKSGVAPLVGAWIETVSSLSVYVSSIFVAPLVGAWIETSHKDNYYPGRYRRSPRGSVD